MKTAQTIMSVLLYFVAVFCFGIAASSNIKGNDKDIFAMLVAIFFILMSMRIKVKDNEF